MKKKPFHKLKRKRYQLTVMYVGGIDDSADKLIELMVGFPPASDSVMMQGDRARDLLFDVGNDLVKGRDLKLKLHGTLVGEKYITASLGEG